MERKVLVSILLCVFFVAQLHATFVSILSSSPNESNISGRKVIAVRGCGFRQHNTAVCTWDFKYFSPIHVILSDDLIYCETPQLTKDDFDVLPTYTKLYVYFDGNLDDNYEVNDNFRFGPSIVSFTPFDGYINGGEEFRIIGDGFNEFSSVNVTFDDVSCLNTTILSNNEILCTVPPGEFNQNAIVNLKFENNSNYYLHFEKTYHYGPILYGVTPSCGLVTGGTRVTVLGVNLDDPFISFDAPPANVIPDVEVIYNNGQKRLYALDVNFVPGNNLITFTTPNISYVFGEKVRFDVYFKKVLSKVAVTVEGDFTYGPIIFHGNLGTINDPYYPYTPHTITNPSITSGSLGGGEEVLIYGCGFSQFNVSQYQVFFNNQVFCKNGTLEILTSGELQSEALRCTVDSLGCGTNVNGNFGNITIQLNANITNIADPQILPPPNEPVLSYRAGPVLDINSISTNRGPRTGGQLVSIYGENLFYSYDSTAASPGWNVTVNFVDYENITAVVLPSVQASFVADNLISFVTPPGLFDLDVAITFTFGNCTGALQNTFALYHFGPLCYDMTPVNGHYTGGSIVTLIGEGFEEDGNLASDTYVQMCINRLSNSTHCVYEQVPRDTFALNDTQIIFQTPSSRQNIVTTVGNNILFGDQASVYIHFYQPGGEFIEFPRNQLKPGLPEAIISCGPYTFAPKVRTITPNNAQVVPRFNGTPLPVEIGGEFFDDPNLQNRLVVGVSNVITLNPSIVSDETITAEVNWGLKANTDNTVYVFFDTGNQTFSSVDIGFGPAIYSIFTEYSPIHAGDDVYGLFPAGGQSVTIVGERFLDNPFIKITIGGDEVDYTVESSTEIICTTPCKSYGTRAQLTVSFGTFCNEGVDYSRSLTASQYLYYNPRIDSFSPTYGRTSGGESVTIQGEGFAGWGKYECFFGHYSDQQHVTPSADGTTIVCTTPINRAEFNTYVSVQIQLSAYDDDDAVEENYVEGDQECSDRQTVVDEGFYAGVENHDFKVFAPEKYYYGPVCNDISPSSCPTTGCVAAVVGSGFRDCSTGNQTVYTKTYPYNDCIFRYYKVRYVDPITKEITYLNGPTNDTLSPGNSDTKLYYYAPARDCGYEPEIEIEFFSPDVSTAPSSDGLTSQTIIQCSNHGRSFDFHYGPVVSGQTSKFYDSSRSTSYGWSGDTVTITGIDFRDTNIYGSISCNFGPDLTVPAASVDTTGSTVVCQVPTVSSEYWNTLVDITLSWSGGVATCPEVPAKQFHFGPTIRSSTPSRGYVAGQTPITISGYAFGCCGITSYSCLFPDGSSSAQLSGTNSVTCNVPQNDLIDLQINNIGVSFTSSLFGTFGVTYTEYQTSLKYYYGPSVDSYSPSHSTLSGRDQYVVINGEGFDDPYLLETFCDYFPETSPGFEYVPRDPIEEVFITATTITCPIPTFAHYAGAVDKIRPRWRRSGDELRPELGKNYFKTEAPALDDAPGAPYYSDGGSETPVYLSGFKYGPVITGVCAAGSCDLPLPRSSLSGGLQVTVHFDSLRDFVATPGTFDFGRQNAICVFGNRFSTSLVPINANPDDDDGGTVVCTTPSGDFGFTGELSVILNPNIVPLSTTAPSIFHARPYTTGISRDWASTSGFETIVVYGSGFCRYSYVECSFSNGESQNDATQGEITNDFTVTCRTPPRPAGHSFITLRFCDSTFSCQECNNDIVEVPQQITFYGINSVSPIDGSLCGGSSIQFSGYGFSSFDRITCSFPNSGLQVGTIVNDNLFTCSSVDISLIFNNDYVHCSEVSIIGIRDNFNYPLSVPNRFEYGLPQLLSITPPTQEMNSLGQIVARGLYFNGNGFNVDCQFGGFASSPGTLVAESNAEYAVICFPPSSITVGTYDFSLVFGCSSTAQFTTNVLHFTVTQTPIIEQVRPIAGPEIGGQTITISGFNFNGGSLYLCVFGKIAVGAAYDETDSVITCKTPAFLDTYEDVKIPLYVSLDGGETLFRSRDDYIYQNIAVVQDGNVCVNGNDINEGSHLSPASIFVTILFVCISLAFF